MPGTRRRTRREILAIGCALSATLLLADLLFYPRTTEDAFITFRYSEHLAEGFGFGAWNTDGGRVEGYTSTLWMVALAAAPWAGIRIETLAKALGVAAQLGLCGLLLGFPLWRSAQRAAPDDLLGADADAFAIAALVCGAYLPAVWYATSGMETTAFALLVALALLAPLVWSGAAANAAVYAALVAMRPEGALVGAAFGALHAVCARADGRSPRAALGALAGWAGALAALTAFRLAVFGEWVPNTWWAKAAGAGEMHRRLGAEYLGDWLAHHSLWVAGAAVALAFAARGLRDHRARAQLGVGGLAALAGVWTLYVWRVGGDNPSAFPGWRQLLHLQPVFALLVAFAIVRATSRRALRFALAALCIVATNVSVLRADGFADDLRDAAAGFPRLTHDPPNPAYVWLAELSTPQTVVASAAAGEMPFVVDARHIDMLGLNDREIAHRGRFDPDGPVDSKSDVDSVMRRRPDVIQSTLRSGRFDRASPRGNRILHRGEMEAALLSHPDFVRDYLYVRNAPYEFRDRAIFVRRDFWSAHPQRARLDVVPVRRTAIYREPAP